jgi:hypothetical protein
MLTRSDFDLIAAAMVDAHAQISATPYFRPGQDLAAFYGHRLTCENLATALKTINPHFNRERFLAACTNTHTLPA